MKYQTLISKKIKKIEKISQICRSADLVISRRGINICGAGDLCKSYMV